MILILIITIIALLALLIKSDLKYKTLKLEWEEQNSAFDVLTSNYSKAKKEISGLQDQYDDLSIRCNNEIQRLTEKYEKKLSVEKAHLKAVNADYDALVLKEAEYLTSLEEAAMREANYLNTIADLQKTIDAAAAKKERAKARAKKKKEEKVEQLEITYEEDGSIVVTESVTIDDVDIAAGEGEIKCEKKRRRKKGDSE